MARVTLNPKGDRAGSDRGAILIQTAITIFVLTGLCAFVLDSGVLWLCRRQAQNAADAGALAAGTALLYDGFGDRTDTGPAHLSGVAAAQLNLVFGQAPGVIVDQSLTAGSWTPQGPQTCVDVPGSCAQASVYRDGTNNSATLPTYFAQIFGQTSQQVRATATVQLRSGNGTKCLKPWFASDKSETTTYGINDINDVGTLLILHAIAGPSSYQQSDFDSSGASCGGTDPCYIAAVTSCVAKASDGLFKIGDVIQEKPRDFSGPVGTAAQDLFLQDQFATWNDVTKTVENSCAATRSCTCANAQGDGCANGMNGLISPRIVAIGLYLPSQMAVINTPGTQSAPINNIAGAFLLEPGHGPSTFCTDDPHDQCGYLMPTPGTIGSGGTPAQGGTLNVVLSLIR